MRKKNVTCKMTAFLLTAVMCVSLCTGFVANAQEAGDSASQQTETEEQSGRTGQNGQVKETEQEGDGLPERTAKKETNTQEASEKEQGQQEKNPEAQEQSEQPGGGTAAQESMPLSASNLSNPRIEKDSGMTAGQKVTWDCVWFGSYPQAEVVPSADSYTAVDKSLLKSGDIIENSSLYSKLQNATGWNSNNDIIVDGNKYRRMKKSDATFINSECYNWSDSNTYHYFKYEPIKWRVLKINGNQAFLLSDISLDDQTYNTVDEDITWETSTIRSWLNGYKISSNKQGNDYSNKNFIGSAFTLDERSSIINTTVINADNLNYGTEGGNDTTDKVYLLSELETYGDSAVLHGFVSSKDTSDEARRSKSSTYAKAMGTWSNTSEGYEGNCWWWSRSMGKYADGAVYVHTDGCIFDYDGGRVDSVSAGVRPALNLNLSSNLHTYAGTVSSDDNTGENTGDEEDYDSSKIAIKAIDYSSFGFDNIEGAKAEVEGIGEAVTNTNGEAFIKNSLSESSLMKRIAITKKGYRDYIFYTTIVSQDLVTIFQTNKISASLKKKKAGDDTNPYVSTVMYYSNEIAKTCGGQRFEKADTVTFRACGVWSGKNPGYYCLYQNGPGGRSLESEDGIFKVKIGDAFSGRGDIYVVSAF